MDGDEIDFLERRAEEELEAAARSEIPSVVAAHYRMAGLYLDQLYGRGDEILSLTSAAASGWKL